MHEVHVKCVRIVAIVHMCYTAIPMQELGESLIKEKVVQAQHHKKLVSQVDNTTICSALMNCCQCSYKIKYMVWNSH